MNASEQGGYMRMLSDLAIKAENCGISTVAEMNELDCKFRK